MPLKWLCAEPRVIDGAQEFPHIQHAIHCQTLRQGEPRCEPTFHYPYYDQYIIEGHPGYARQGLVPYHHEIPASGHQRDRQFDVEPAHVAR